MIAIAGAGATLVNFALPTSLGTGGATPKSGWSVDQPTITTVQSLQGVANTAVSLTAVVVPEPSAFAMLGLGALGLIGFRRLGLRKSA